MTTRYDRDRIWTCSCGNRIDPKLGAGHKAGCTAPGARKPRCILRERGVAHNGHGPCPGVDFPQAQWDEACARIASGGR
jgi:hypothetical protein